MKKKLLSPQHWDQQRYTRTIHLNPKGYVGILQTAPIITKYCNVCLQIEEDAQVLAMPMVLETSKHYEEEEKDTPEATNVIRDNEGKGEEENKEASLPLTAESTTVSEESQIQHPPGVRVSPQALDLFKEEEKDDSEGEEFTFTTMEHGYLHWHNKLRHTSHARLLQLAKNGVLPNHLAKVTPSPLCASCIYGKMTIIPCRVKGYVPQTPRVVTKPGECIAVDQLESMTPGFISQLKGNILMKGRYRYAGVFVDQYSTYTYVHFQVRLTSEETVRAKNAFEAHLLTHGVKVQQYHMDNGRFQDNLFKNDCKNKNQRLTFCGVNAHFQNGRGEKKIRDLQDATRTSLLHAMRKWPDAINISHMP